MDKLQFKMQCEDTWDLLRTEFLWVYWAQVRESPTSPAGNHQTWDGPFEGLSSAFLVHEGQVDLKFGESVYSCFPGNWFFVEPGIRLQRIHPQTNILSIGYEAEWLTGKPLFNSLNLQDAKQANDRLYEISKKLFHQLHGENQVSVSFVEAMQKKKCSLQAHLRFRHVFQEWIASLVDRLEALGAASTIIGSTSPRSLRFIQILENISFSTPLDKRHIENQMQLSWRRLEQIFIEAFEMSPNEFIQRRRFREAKRLLKLRDTPIKEISYLLGFPQASSFSIWFKNQADKSPKAYREAISELGPYIDGPISADSDSKSMEAE
ncbi:AraC family transcriptional regulator [Rubellicoccus peritrichatus]|uniref:AraC family transcriptional regulator n=1 Tax=Rubellicoccus peritrichatus TaxID=3080537 RepID=A0AAQ3QT40_9BACT|nr:AraC family transcriptional regulator [Puniceicoccus sp. CR14]WOO43283.1 AraC family transcriptional regulator [Puniceicoccus sp. CR14]